MKAILHVKTDHSVDQIQIINLSFCVKYCTMTDQVEVLLDIWKTIQSLYIFIPTYNNRLWRTINESLNRQKISIDSR